MYRNKENEKKKTKKVFLLKNVFLLDFMLICLMFRTKQVIKVMRAKDNGGKKIGSNKDK